MRRTGAARNSGRPAACELTAAAVAVGMYEHPPPRWRQAPTRAGSEAIVRYAAGGAEVSLGAYAETQQGSGRAGERHADALDAGGGHARDLRAGVERVVVEPGEQVVEASGVRAAPLLVDEPRVTDRPHHPQREHGVAAGQRPQVLVGDAGGAAAVGIDHDQPRPVGARVEQQPPEVRRGRHRVPAPDDHVARVRPLLGVDLGREPVGGRCSRDAGGGADRAHELAGTERVHEAIAHHAALHEALGSHVAVGQDRLAPVLLARRAQSVSHAVERLVPGRPPETARPLRALAQERLQKAVAGVDAIEVVRHLAAEESARDGVLGVAADGGRPAVLHGHVHRARVGTVVRTGSANDAHGRTVTGQAVPGKQRSGHSPRPPGVEARRLRGTAMACSTPARIGLSSPPGRAPFALVRTSTYASSVLRSALPAPAGRRAAMCHSRRAPPRNVPAHRRDPVRAARPQPRVRAITGRPHRRQHHEPLLPAGLGTRVRPPDPAVLDSGCSNSSSATPTLRQVAASRRSSSSVRAARSFGRFAHRFEAIMSSRAARRITIPFVSIALDRSASSS